MLISIGRRVAWISEWSDHDATLSIEYWDPDEKVVRNQKTQESANILLTPSPLLKMKLVQQCLAGHYNTNIPIWWTPIGGSKNPSTPFTCKTINDNEEKGRCKQTGTDWSQRAINYKGKLRILQYITIALMLPLPSFPFLYIMQLYSPNKLIPYDHLI